MTAQLTWRAWNLVGLSITRLQIDRQIRLDIESTDCALALVFKTECYLQVANRVRHQLVAAQPETLTPLLPTLHQPLMRFMTSSTGHCKLLLANGTVIWADPTPSNNWESYGQGTLVSASFNGASQLTVQRLVAR